MTVFTMGRNLTLVLAAKECIVVPSDVIEFLIVATILITVLYDAFFGLRTKWNVQQKSYWNDTFILFFGLIHGMGFSNFFRSLLDQSSEIVLPLFAFNVGIEVGQLANVGIMLIFVLVAMNIFLSSSATGIYSFQEEQPTFRY